MEDLTVTLIQTQLDWENPEQNRIRFEKLFSKIDQPTDLILLPEVFNTGFSINPAVCAEQSDGPSMQFIRTMAKEKGSCIATTLIIREQAYFYNRLVFCFPDETCQTYDKRHLFRLSEEHRLFEPGQIRRVVSWKGWNILPLVCYDLRFPVWSKNRYHGGQYEYDLLVYLANWPESRSSVWRSLLVARAIENQAYVIGVNRIGPDGHGTRHRGDSMVVDPKGKILFHAEPEAEHIGYQTISGEALVRFREAFPVGMDWDKFTIH